MDTRAKLTDSGKEKLRAYIEEITAKRKEILDAELDIARVTPIPTIESVAEDIGSDFDNKNIDAWVRNAPFAEMEYTEYSNVFEVTDNIDAEKALVLKAGEDFTILPLLEDFFKWEYLVSDDDEKEWYVVVEGKGEMPYELNLSTEYKDDECSRVLIDGQYYYF